VEWLNVSWRIKYVQFHRFSYCFLITKDHSLTSDKRSRLIALRFLCPLRVNYRWHNQRSVRLKSTKSHDSDKKSRRYYEGGDTVSSRACSSAPILSSLARSLSWRETDGGLYYVDSYYHQLNSYTTSGPWCSYVILGDARRWYLVHCYMLPRDFI